MKKFATTAITPLILFALVVPVAFLSLPDKAQAVAGSAAACTAGFAASAVAQAPDAVQQAVGVPKASLGDFFQGIFTGGSVNTEAFKSCILKPLGSLIAITLIRNIGSSVVNWVNSGFQGNPAFVTDLEGTLLDTADQAIGTFIEGSDLGFLCNDFGFQVRLALALKYSQPFREKARCTLSEIADNVSTNGGRGWDNFLSISTEPQNNVYGAYLIAETEVAQKVFNKVSDKGKKIAIADGFLDFETCDESDDPKQLEADDFENTRLTVDSLTAEKETLAAGVKDMVASGDYTGYDNVKNRQNAIDLKLLDLKHADAFKAPDASANQPIGTPKGKVCTKKSTKTPGKIIGNKLSSVLGQGEIQSAVAQEIDQVIAATLNQLAQKVIQGAGGLLGTSKKRSSSQDSYLERYRSQYYGESNTTGGATSELEDYQLNSYDQTSALLNDTSDPNLNSINTVFESTVSAGSQQQQEQVASISDSYSGISGGSTAQNIALLKPSSQSSGSNPSGANDGVTQTSQYTRGSSTSDDDADPWWQVDLGEVKKIKEVRVWAVGDKPASQTLETFRVVVGGGAGQWSSNLISGAGATNPIIVPVNQSGSTVRIEKTATPYQCSRFEFDEDCYHPLELAEVQVMEEIVAPSVSVSTPTNTTGSSSAGNTSVVADTRTGTSTLSWSPASPSTISIGASKPLSHELKLGAEKTASNLTVEIGLYKNGSRVPFLSVFNDDFDILRGASGGSKSSSQSVITPSIGAIRFRMSVDGGSSYSFTFKGSLQSNAPLGEYSFQAKVSDNTDTELSDKSQTTSFSL